MEIEHDLRYDINTQFGTRNEHDAIMVYERRSGTEVRSAMLGGWLKRGGGGGAGGTHIMLSFNTPHPGDAGAEHVGLKGVGESQVELEGSEVTRAENVSTRYVDLF